METDAAFAEYARMTKAEREADQLAWDAAVEKNDRCPFCGHHRLDAAGCYMCKEK